MGGDDRTSETGENRTLQHSDRELKLELLKLDLSRVVRCRNLKFLISLFIV